MATADTKEKAAQDITKKSGANEMKFVHLHTHSHYSLLDGLSKVTDLVKTAVKYGMPALALTDHGAMYGAIDFYMEAKKAGLKPILGVEGYLAARGRKDKETGLDSRRNHITLFAKNETGYRNLMRLTTMAHLEGFYYKPRMDKEILRAYSEGIICLSGCPASEMGMALRENNMDRARELVIEYQEIFGKDNYFLEIMAHQEVPGWENWKNGIIKLHEEFGIPIVGTHDSHYLMHDDQDAHEALLRINTGADGKDGSKGMSMKDGDYHLINTEEAIKLFEGIPGAVENTSMVAEMCELDLVLGKFVFPEFALPEGVTTDAALKELAYAGLERRGIAGDAKSIERLDYELSVIAMKGYAAYFLVVEDLIRYAHENKILTNIRGSVAGSMTTYVLGITSVNPLEYKLPFERFLNPDRPSAPDIDMDFADDRRDEVIEYAKRKYGADKVAQIGTFGTMMARGAVRDVARALGYPYDMGDRLSKMIPMGSQGMPMTIDHAMELEPELKKAYDTEGDTRRIIDLAKKIEGGVRHISVHAAGVVISPRPLVEYVPLQFDPKGGKLITQYDMYTVGEDGVGLTKFDFLGIRNLSILAEAVQLVEQRHGVIIDLENIPLNDPRTFALLARGQTEGLFQLNGSGMTRYLKELKPSTIHDINAMVALYRPGPMEAIPEYIKRKHNPSLVRYLDPRMKEILDTSFGVITYQDDVMMLAIKLAGYTWIEADKLRKAMGKKIPAEMEAQKDKLLKGFVANGLSKEKANELWLLIEPFAAYGFNKAHAASYGRVSYQTAYMKANYPVEYMTAIMTAESGDVEKVADIIAECKNMNITVLPPDVNECFGGFTVINSGDNNGTGGIIRFGLYTIKNLGTDISDAIIEERKDRGPFLSIGDFLDRVHHKNLNKKSLEALIKTGAMDAFGERATLFGNIENMLEYNREGKKNAGMISLFGDLPDAGPTFNLQAMPPINISEILVWEKELLGLYVSGHPLDKIKDKLLGRALNIKKVHEGVGNGMSVVLAGIIETVRPVFTKKNDRMAFIRIADFSGAIEAVVFPKTFTELSAIIIQDKTIAFEGKVTVRNGEKSIVIEKLKEI